MKRNISMYSLLLILGLIAFGCASIMEGGKQSLPIDSTPPGAKVRVVNTRTGEIVAEGTTPLTITLNRGAGFFKKGKYKVIIEKEGYDTKEVEIKGEPNLWYIGGNLVFGNLIGWLIVDPITGAMWTLQPKDIDATLAKKVSGVNPKGLTIVLTSQLPPLPKEVKAKFKPVSIEDKTKKN